MADQYVDDGVVFFRSQDVKPFRVDTKSALRVSAAFADSLTKSELRAGDVVVVRTGYPGTAAVIPDGIGRANCADLVVITPGPDLDPYVLVSVFNSTFGKRLVSGRLVGAAQQHFNVSAAKALELRLPPIEEQRMIGGIVRLFNDLMENNRRRIGILEEIARLLYREWFVHFRFPGHEDIDIVDSDLGPIPEEWTPGCFSDIVSEIKDAVGADEITAGSLVLGLEHLPRRSTTLDQWEEDAQVRSRQRVFIAGDILFGKIRPYLHKVIDAPISGYSSTSAIVFRPKDDLVRSRALAVASSDDFIGVATATSNGTTMPSANAKILLAFGIPHPTIDVEQAFSEVVQPMDSLRKTLAARNRVLRRARDLLLPHLVSGEFDVSKLDVDLAAV